MQTKPPEMKAYESDDAQAVSVSANHSETEVARVRQWSTTSLSRSSSSYYQQASEHDRLRRGVELEGQLVEVAFCDQRGGALTDVAKASVLIRLGRPTTRNWTSLRWC